LVTRTVTPNASSGGSINPSALQNINNATTLQVQAYPDTGYSIVDVTGTCGGTLSGNNFTTNPVTADCTITATLLSVKSMVLADLRIMVTLQLLNNKPCATGTASTTTGNDPWSWVCSGLYGGTNANCSTDALENNDFGNALNSPLLTFTTGGDSNWFIETTDTHDGVAAVSIGNHQRQSGRVHLDPDPSDRSGTLSVLVESIFCYTGSSYRLYGWESAQRY